MQRVVDDRVSTGHVTFALGLLDRRAPRVSLTAAVETCTADLFAASESNREALLARAGTSAEDLIQAASTLRSLVAALHDEDAGSA